MIKVGFILNFNKEDWLGGYNYYKNLFFFLRNSDRQKIEPIILTDNFSRYKNDKDINKLKIIENNFFSKSNTLIRVFHKLLIIFFGKNFFLENFLKKNNIRAISHKGYLGKYSKIKSFPWFPDFQEIYFPENFSKKDLLLRKLDVFFSKIHGTRIIISSNQVRNDLKKIDKEAFKKSVLLKHPINLPKLSSLLSLDQLKKKYDIKKKYFFLPNHYWKHKNHIVVLNALEKLIKKNFIIISTGQTYDHRDSTYFLKLKKMLKKKNINKYYKILGIVPFEDMVALMRYSIAVINPSKSEGLSNTVEQAKALGKTVILSDILIHREQKTSNFFFFDANNYLQLADILFKLSIKKAINIKSNKLNKKLLNDQTSFINKYQNFIISNLKNSHV
jgi:hypothetical protein